MDKMPKLIWTVTAMIVAVTVTATVLLAQDELDVLRQAAEQGDATAQYRLGAIYANGESVPADYAKAVRWYRLAAEQGLAMAQGALGGMYAIGRGVPQDDVEAARWLRLAAEQGYAAAQGALGGMYMHGRGVPHDASGLESASFSRAGVASGISGAASGEAIDFRHQSRGDGLEAVVAETMKQPMYGST